MYYLMDPARHPKCCWDMKLAELFQIFSEAEQASLHQKSQCCSLRVIQGSSCPVPCAFPFHFQAEMPLKMVAAQQGP